MMENYFVQSSPGDFTWALTVYHVVIDFGDFCQFATDYNAILQAIFSSHAVTVLKMLFKYIM